MSDKVHPPDIDPWHDPEFSPHSSGPRKAGTSIGNGRGRRDASRRGISGPASVLALLLAAFGLDFLLDPMFGPMMLALVADVGLALGVMAGAMALGTLGFVLFAAGDQVVAWFRRSAEWPDG
jgi:hypothetical protein